MKKSLIKSTMACSLLTLPTISAYYGTFFRPRSITFDQTYNLALTNYALYHGNASEQQNTVFLYATPFYQRSLQEKKLGAFFLPNKKSCMSIKEDGTGDIGSLWLDLIAGGTATFSSQICLKPQRTAAGCFFNARFNLDALWSNVWLQICFTALEVKHAIGLCEYNVQNPGILPGIATVKDALANATWSFGKIVSCSLRKTGVDDIQLKLGHDWLLGEHHMTVYGVAGIPTGKASQARFLFEPLVGTPHGFIGFGLNGDYRHVRDADTSVTLMADAKYLYGFKAHERRSFDLCNQGRWSRYLQLVKQSAPSFSQPGINTLTRLVETTPRSSFDLWLALHYQHACYHIEFGYDLWFRQQEKLSSVCSFPQGVGVYDMVGDCARHPVSASRACICESVTGPNKAPSDTVFTPISVHSLNLSSAATPMAVTSKVYGACARDFMVAELPLQCGFIGSYEFSHTNAALTQWAVMFNCGVQF